MFGDDDHDRKDKERKLLRHAEKAIDAFEALICRQEKRGERQDLALDRLEKLAERAEKMLEKLDTANDAASTHLGEFTANPKG